MNLPTDARISGLDWAKRVLDLELPADASPDQLQAAALDSFFRGMGERDYFPDTVTSEAVEVILGKSPSLSREFIHLVEQQHFWAIDAIVEQYSGKLGLTHSRAAQGELRELLSPYLSQASSAAVGKYAEQVLQAAEVTESPLSETNALAQTLAQAVFHISAIRSSQRRSVRMNWVNRLRDRYCLGDLHDAAMIVESQYRIANHKYHQPFLQLVRWPDEHTDVFQIADPIRSDSRSVVAYSQDFGKTHQPAPPTSGSTNWSWLIFAIVFGLMVSGISRLPNSPEPKPQLMGDRRLPSVRVVVFDKDDPNKFAYDLVSDSDAIGYPTEPSPSPAHPGPFVEVPLDEINRAVPKRPELSTPETRSLEAIELLLRNSRNSTGGSK